MFKQKPESPRSRTGLGGGRLLSFATVSMSVPSSCPLPSTNILANATFADLSVAPLSHTYLMLRSF